MPMDFLRRIEHAALPLVATAQGDINSAVLLDAAGYIRVEHHPTVLDEPVVILSITALGKAALRRVPRLPDK